MLGKNIVRLSVMGLDYATVVNVCLDKGWEIRNLIPKEECLELDLFLKDSKDFIKWVRENRGKIHIVKRRGGYVWWRRLQKRKGLAVGFVLAFSIVFLGLSYIWSYEVDGNKWYTTDEVIELVQGYGLKIGAAKNNLDYEAISREILKDYNGELSWFWANPKGTVLEIRLKEKDNGDENAFRMNDLVAERDGYVEKMLILQGTGLVGQGEWVKKGQVLIQGTEYEQWERDELGNFVGVGMEKAVKARGVVQGLTLYYGEGVCAMVEDTIEAIEPKRRYRLRIGEEEITIGRSTKEEMLQREVWKKEVGLGDWDIVLLAVDEYGVVHRKREYSFNEAYEEALVRARGELQEQVKYGDMVEESIKTTTEEGVVKVQLQWIVRENLAIEAYK